MSANYSCGAKKAGREGRPFAQRIYRSCVETTRREEMIMESDSKKKRGRPRRFDEALTLGMRAALKIRSERAATNRAYALHASEVLTQAKDARLEWLMTPDYASAILTELGRIADDVALKIVALELNPNHPVKTNAARVRQQRLKRKPKATVEGLNAALKHAYLHYAATHDGCTKEILLKAMGKR
jgi:hypothetical protein